MDKLIETLKQRDQIAANTLEIQNRIRLHNAQIIEAKAPDFWALAIDHVRVLASEMRREFPDNSRRHLVIENLPNGLFLNAGGLPRRILAAQLDTKGQRVVLSVRVKEEFDHHPEPQKLSSGSITVGPQEEVIFKVMGKKSDDPQDVARALVAYVCDV